MILNFFLILFLFKWSDCCKSAPYTFKFMDIEILDRLQSFPWLVTIKDQEDSVFKLGYGALIHPQIVITSALVIEGYSKQNISVETNCSIASSWILHDCVQRQVVEVITLKKELNHEDYYEHNYILLILEYPLPVEPIKIADNVNNIKPKNCYFLRWMREINRSYVKKELMTIKYKTTFNNGHLDVNSFNKVQLWTDRDFIISRKFHFKMVNLQIKNQNFLNFMGSPLICQDLNNPEYFFLAGIGTFNLRINMPTNIIDFASDDQFTILSQGSFINLITYFRQIHKIINDKKVMNYLI